MEQENKIWLRLGVRIDITEGQANLIEESSEDERPKVIKSIVKENVPEQIRISGLAFQDGDSYVPFDGVTVKGEELNIGDIQIY